MDAFMIFHFVNFFFVLYILYTICIQTYCYNKPNACDLKIPSKCQKRCTQQLLIIIFVKRKIHSIFDNISIFSLHSNQLIILSQVSSFFVSSLCVTHINPFEEICFFTLICPSALDHFSSTKCTVFHFTLICFCK